MNKTDVVIQQPCIKSSTHEHCNVQLLFDGGVDSLLWTLICAAVELHWVILGNGPHMLSTSLCFFIYILLFLFTLKNKMSQI